LALPKFNVYLYQTTTRKRYLVAIQISFMDINPASEVRDYLKHKDYSLAVRRLLDLCLDRDDEVLLRDAINWSRAYHAAQELQPGETPDPAFFEKAGQLTERVTLLSQRPGGMLTHLLKANNISMSYGMGGFKLLPMSLQISSGDILGIVGENGNGKTTLLRCLAGQLALNEGQVEYAALSHPDYYTIKNHVAFIPQRIPRWYGQLKDNLHFSAAIAGVKGLQNELMVDFMLERLNLTRYAHLTWNQISSGYRTRFEIARILLQKPSLLILDEPLANLDINAQQTILTDLRYLVRSAYHPMGVVLSSQQLHEVEKVADKVLFIKQGQCLNKPSAATATNISYAIEIESPAAREAIVEALGEADLQLQYNGGFYTITSARLEPQQLLTRLIAAQIPVTYFRDITHSAKRFF
jgi:ABC-2 type transport system ATP-binding protein